MADSDGDQRRPFFTRGQPVRYRQGFPLGRAHPSQMTHIMVDHAYAQYIPPNPYYEDDDGNSPLPLLFVHGPRMKRSMWELTPDGRDGWAFLASRGPNYRPVFLFDAAESARSPKRTCSSRDTNRTTRDLWKIARIGPPRSYRESNPSRSGTYSNSQFPMVNFETLVSLQRSDPKAVREDRKRQFSAEVTALSQVIDRIGQCDIIAHGAGCSTAIKALQKRNRHLVRALVMVEPGPPKFLRSLAIGVRSLFVWGDNVEGHDEWKNIRKAFKHFEDSYGYPQVWNLPQRGLPGNSHFPMHDMNSGEVGQDILNWFQGLSEDSDDNGDDDDDDDTMMDAYYDDKPAVYGREMDHRRGHIPKRWAQPEVYQPRSGRRQRQGGNNSQRARGHDPQYSSHRHAHQPRFQGHQQPGLQRHQNFGPQGPRRTGFQGNQHPRHQTFRPTRSQTPQHGLYQDSHGNWYEAPQQTHNLSPGDPRFQHSYPPSPPGYPESSD